MKYKVGDIVFSTIWKKSVLIKDIRPNRFYLIADLEYLSRTMITYESNLKSREDDIEKDMEEHQKIVDEIMTIQGIEPIEAEIEEVWHCPDGYIFKDENGNVINATKIVLEKKKKEYPTFKNLGECKEILGEKDMYQGVSGYKGTLLTNFQRLLIFRDAYWKIAGDWKPKFNSDCLTPKYIMTVDNDRLIKSCTTQKQYILSFPTEEMRDAFYENFKELIEQCKELL